MTWELPPSLRRTPRAKLGCMGGWGMGPRVCLPRAKLELQFHVGRGWVWRDNAQCAGGGPLRWEEWLLCIAWWQSKRVRFQFSLGTCPAWQDRSRAPWACSHQSLLPFPRSHADVQGTPFGEGDLGLSRFCVTKTPGKCKLGKRCLKRQTSPPASFFPLVQISSHRFKVSGTNSKEKKPTPHHLQLTP